MLSRALLGVLLLFWASWTQALADESVYYSLRQDARKCVFPLCGGVFAQALNRLSTRCAEGRRRTECYAAEVDWSALNLSEAQANAAHAAISQGRVLIKGRLLKKNYGNFGALGELKVDEAWEAATEAPAQGVFYRVASNNIVCIAAPCLSFREEKLNSPQHQDIAGIDLSRVGASASQLNAANAQLSQAEGLLAAAWHYTARGAAGKAKALRARQFYLPLSAESPQACYVGGCSGQLCSERSDAVSTCEYLPEYACYRSAQCERQGDGGCGWTPSAELQACLEAARGAVKAAP
jgi:hypothetical protein